MSKQTFEERCLLAEQCLPDAPYRAMLKQLHAEMLSKLAKQLARQEPVAWKLVPKEPTHEMLKAMDECSTEGYDERLYAGHASSVYMAAVDAAPTPPAQRKPLTSEEVSDLRIKHGITSNGRGIKEFTQIVDFVRDIEAAHKIKENT